MIIGIGIDIVEINRFKQWNKRPEKQLMRIFTQQEIEYCLKNDSKSAERFAVRFCAKEAFYKAAYAHLTKKISFFSLCQYIEVLPSPEGLEISWIHVNRLLPEGIKAHLSMTHSSSNAGAVVILELKNPHVSAILQMGSVDKGLKSDTL